MKIVGFNKTPAKFAREQLTDRCFAGARDSENDYHSWRINFSSAADLFHRERHKNKKRVENPNTRHRGFICQRRARHVRIADLNNNENKSERDHSSFANCWHRVSREVQDDPGGEQRDLQRKLRVAIIPQTKTDFPFVVVDREIARDAQ